VSHGLLLGLSFLELDPLQKLGGDRQKWPNLFSAEPCFQQSHGDHLRIKLGRVGGPENSASNEAKLPENAVNLEVQHT